jgi:hypothetical protein
MSSYYRSILNVQAVAPALDPDAQAFLTATGITDATITSAINTYVLDLKGFGIWTKMKAIYPIVGGTAATHKFNLKDPRDLDAAFRLSFFGGITHSVNGMQGNAINGYIRTYFNPSIQLSNPAHLSLYVYDNLTTSTDQIDMGCLDLSNRFLWISTRYNGSGFNNFLGRNTSGSVLQDAGINADARGQYQTNKVVTTAKLHKNGVVADTKTDSQLQPNIEIYLLAYNNVGTPIFYSNRTISLPKIGEGLTDTEAANLYTADQTLQTLLGRNV